MTRKQSQTETRSRPDVQQYDAAMRSALTRAPWQTCNDIQTANQQRLDVLINEERARQVAKYGQDAQTLYHTAVNDPARQARMQAKRDAAEALLNRMEANLASWGTHRPIAVGKENR